MLLSDSGVPVGQKKAFLVASHTKENTLAPVHAGGCHRGWESKPCPAIPHRLVGSDSSTLGLGWAQGDTEHPWVWVCRSPSTSQNAFIQRTLTSMQLTDLHPLCIVLWSKYEGAKQTTNLVTNQKTLKRRNG